MIRPADHSFKIRDYVESLFRHKKKILVYNLLVLLFVVGIIMLWPRKYRSEAKIWIKIGRENSHLDPTAATGETISIQETDREDEIKSVLDVVASRGVITSVVEKLTPAVVLGDAPLPGQDDQAESSAIIESMKELVGSVVSVVKQIDPISEKEEAIQEIVKNVDVGSERKSNVVSIEYDSDSPALAQAVVDALIEQYTLRHAQIFVTRGSRTFFEEQKSELRTEVEEKANALKTFKDKMGLASVGGHRGMLEGQMNNVQQQKMDTLRELEGGKARIEMITSMLAQQPKNIRAEEKSVPNTGRDLVRAQLYELQVQRMELEARLKDHPRIDAIKKQEADARRELSKRDNQNRMEVTQAINEVHQELMLDLGEAKAAVAGSKAMLAAITEQEALIATRIEELNSAEIDIEQLKRDLNLAVNNYTKYSDNLEDARISEALDKREISNISVAQAPTFEEKPISPSKGILMLLGLFAMFLGTVAIAVGLQAIDNSARRSQQFSDAIGAPVLVSIPDSRRFRHVLK
jgi:uncharacterized protein involved in exopolysaccharide biosynthesis